VLVDTALLLFEDSVSTERAAIESPDPEQHTGALVAEEHRLAIGREVNPCSFVPVVTFTLQQLFEYASLVGKDTGRSTLCGQQTIATSEQITLLHRKQPN